MPAVTPALAAYACSHPSHSSSCRRSSGSTSNRSWRFETLNNREIATTTSEALSSMLTCSDTFAATTPADTDLLLPFLPLPCPLPRQSRGEKMGGVQARGSAHAVILDLCHASLHQPQPLRCTHPPAPAPLLRWYDCIISFLECNPEACDGLRSVGALCLHLPASLTLTPRTRIYTSPGRPLLDRTTAKSASSQKWRYRATCLPLPSRCSVGQYRREHCQLTSTNSFLTGHQVGVRQHADMATRTCSSTPDCLVRNKAPSLPSSMRSVSLSATALACWLLLWLRSLSLRLTCAEAEHRQGRKVADPSVVQSNSHAVCTCLPGVIGLQ